MIHAVERFLEVTKRYRAATSSTFTFKLKKEEYFIICASSLTINQTEIYLRWHI